MPSQKNIDQVRKLEEKINQAKAIVLTDYRGLKVSQMTELRQKVKEEGAEYKVLKNTLLSLALKNAHYPLPPEPLAGPTAALFSQEDELKALKALWEFAKQNESLQIKLGWFNQELLGEDKVITLAQLPGLEILQAQLVGSLNRPIANLVYSLKESLNKLVKVLGQIGDQTN